MKLTGIKIDLSGAFSDDFLKSMENLRLWEEYVKKRDYGLG